MQGNGSDQPRGGVARLSSGRHCKGEGTHSKGTDRDNKARQSRGKGNGTAMISIVAAWQSIEIICSGLAVSSMARLEKAWI